MLNTKAAANTLDTKTYANLVGEFAKKAFDNGELSEVEYMRIIQPLFGEVGEMVTNQIQDDQNYLEKYADGGRIGFGKGKFVADGIIGAAKFLNKNNPIQLYKKYLQSVKDRTIKGDMKSVAPEVLAIGSGGALVNRFLTKKLEKMNEDQQMKFYEDNKKEFTEEYKDNPELLEIMLKKLDDRTFGEVEEKANGGRTGYKDGIGPKEKSMEPGFETNDPKEAAKEIIKRLIKLDTAEIPISDKISIGLGPNLEEVGIKGIIDILGGELSFGGGVKGDESGVGFNFTKKFSKGGIAGILGE